MLFGEHNNYYTWIHCIWALINILVALLRWAKKITTIHNHYSQSWSAIWTATSKFQGYMSFLDCFGVNFILSLGSQDPISWLLCDIYIPWECVHFLGTQKSQLVGSWVQDELRSSSPSTWTPQRSSRSHSLAKSAIILQSEHIKYRIHAVIYLSPR